MNRKAQYTLNGALIGGIIKLIFNTIDQLNEIKTLPTQKFNWNKLLSSVGKGMLWGGATGFVLGAIEDEFYASSKPINANAYLFSVADNIKLNNRSPEYKINSRKADQIIQELKHYFSDQLASSPYLWGSVVKGTAVQGKSDFDIIVPFNRDCGTIEEMYSMVQNYFKNSYHDAKLIEIRVQAKSTGLIFQHNEQQWKIDVIPMRMSSTSKRRTDGYLHVNPTNIFAETSYTKTDIKLQASVKISNTQQKLIMLLKKWKSDKTVPISSYMIQSYVLEAYHANKGNIPATLSAKLLMVIKHINQNIKTSRLMSIENTNNNINNISEWDKEQIFQSTKYFIDEFNYHPNTIKDLIEGESE